MSKATELNDFGSLMSDTDRVSMEQAMIAQINRALYEMSII